MPADAPLVQAPWAAAFASQDGLILYNGLTGRSLTARGVTQDTWAAFADGPLPRSAVPREAWALVTRELLVPPDADPRALTHNRHPILCRWATFLHAPDRLPLVAEHRAGTGEPWRARRLDALETYVWINCRGEVTVPELLAGAAEHVGPEGPARAWDALRRWASADYQLVKLLDESVHKGGLPHHFFGLVHGHPREGGAPFAPADPVKVPLRTLLAGPTSVLSGRPYAVAVIERLTRGRHLPAGAQVALPPDLRDAVRARRPDLRLLDDPPTAWPEATLDVAWLDQSARPTEDLPEALATAHRALAPGGVAWLLVQGDPRPALNAAQAVGYRQADVRKVGDALDLRDTPVLTGPPAQLAALRALLADQGRPLPLAPWPRAALAAHVAPLSLDWLHHLSFAPATERIMACDTGTLWALTLKR
ncbi:MAG: hypothetical protein H6702_17875 [Myxococcales bacterium]|nr:hypothetical protein [Myxococcales bacterium]